ncbi:nucleotidyl transferase AbiEii/AbiGii toxin family protein [uncultured Thiodictyon sp.]|uniref:nucleotidyl transferase AbiEii/AbiGii toxin family protein n=1 Tax=uncultured Thiodictyon sp. TaxID=1846217 RepID=UPI0026015AA2|nr:nucleotidyl transferase AbiEii/AbiGii toxin family protein [uncultured Thiodictyon sp.]
MGLLRACPEITLSIDDRYDQVVQIGYPAAFSQSYLRPNVQLEIGPLASWVPHGKYKIRPYAAEAFPKLFADPDCPVVAIAAERTFWEKATILHQQAHNPGPIPSRYSRHYYDLSRLAESAVRTAALKDLPLLADVVAFKQRFYPCNWARYDEARPGTFRLIPPSEGIESLEADYKQMRVMIFGECPEFSRIIAALHSLEDEINALES